MSDAGIQPKITLEAAIADRITRFANVLSSAVFAQSTLDLLPVLKEADELLGKACILERLVFTRNVLNTPGVPGALIDRLLADNYLVSRMLSLAGYGLDENKTIQQLSTHGESFWLKIASLNTLSERLTDYLIEIGGPEVAYRLAENRQAPLSVSAIATLFKKAQSDRRLLEALASRPDLNGHFAPANAAPSLKSGGLSSNGTRQPRRMSRNLPLGKRLKVISHN